MDLWFLAATNTGIPAASNPDYADATAASTSSDRTPTDPSKATLANATTSQGEVHPEEVSPSQPADTVTQYHSSNEQEWPLKTILWPPFVDHPREVQILMQDVNGPCSFLALCNVLLVGCMSS